MKRLLALATVCVLALASALSAADAPLRVFIRSGPKSHGPGQHDHPRFLADWVPLLNSRGAVASGGNTFPSAAQLAETDVLVIHAQEGGNITGDDRTNLEAYLKRGGGLVVIHAGAVSRDPDWYKSILGGSWRFGTTKWLEAPMHLYFIDRAHPITRDASNWQMDDEIYYDMDLSPDAHVLATAYTPKAIDTGGRGNKEAQARAAEAVAKNKAVNIYDIQPQLWTYERTIDGGTRPYRAFVSLPGHLYVNFNRPNYRAILLRGIAWAGQRKNADELCRGDELGEALRYPEGGPTAPSKAAAKIEVHPDFKLSLVASEPLINKVMNIDWDEKGRLWVCETPEYPNGRRKPNTAIWKDSGTLKPFVPERDPEDSISILTDTNGDGIMDTKKVFADKLELVTSFVLYKTGVIAATSPDIWLLEDTNGDGVCDKRTKLYTGLGINDTHAVINNLRWGHDGWIYATHGYSRGDVKSGDGTKSFGPDGSGVVRFKPDGSAFEQYSSRNGNTWGLDITWDGQVFWTQPTSGTVFFHTVLPESVLAKGKLPGVTSWKGMITNQRTYPKMEWPEQAYVQIDQVGRFTAAAGCAIYEGGAWPDKWNYSYFTTEPTLNIVHHEFVRRDGVSYSVEKEKGREETEFMRSTDLWFRPIENRVGPDGALYVVDFYNQAVIHNDTRGPQHSPANAAVRPDRDHYFSRIWRVQHKDAKTLPAVALDRTNLASLIQTIETSPNTPTKKLALRLGHENFPGDARLNAVTPKMGSPAFARYYAASVASTPAQRAAILAEFAAASDDWTKSALIAGATEHATDFVTDALASKADAAALSAFVTALAPAIPPTDAGRLVQAASAQPGPLGASLLRGLAQSGTALPALDAPTTAALKTLLAAPETAASALLLTARWDKAGTLADTITQTARRLLTDIADAKASDARRAEIATALVALPIYRAEALAKIGALLSDPAASDATKAPLLATVGELAGREAADVLITAYVQTKSPAIFEQLLKRQETALAVLAALKSNRLTPAAIGPANIARLRTHPNNRVASEAAAVLGAANAGSKEKDALIAKLLPEIQKPGDVANGRELFATACAICHKFGDVGLRDVGPPLAGIGARSATELLTSIVDPNRQVEPNFWQWNITTKKGETFAGVIISETTASLTVRNQGGDTEIKTADIATRENTRRSLMPEGFEGLGAPVLRDLIAYLAASSTAPLAATASPGAVSTPDLTPKAGGRGDAPLPEPTPIVWEPRKTRVLLIGGGSSHKFGEFFGKADSATLRAAGYTVNYTEDRDQATTNLPQADVAVISVNRKFFDTPAYRKALFAFAAAGKGIVMHHPGTWYGFAEWPELNAQIVGGGARGHDRIAKYSVNALKPAHPILQGVPATFEVEDELYYINAEPDKIPAGTSPIEVLAETSPSVKYKAPHPVVWVTKHPTARIVGLTIGHDERVHGLDPFKTLLVNSVKWASGK
ncbi:MAG: ThuA domain-containing protein [Verrucomicrobia bacterium]|nr:ThuA domain-containing protein [Verrucomicrobiota bacterium]